jgi:hypothetical protein
MFGPAVHQIATDRWYVWPPRTFETDHQRTLSGGAYERRIADAGERGILVVEHLGESLEDVGARPASRRGLQRRGAAALSEAGVISTRVAGTYPLDDAVTAYKRLAGGPQPWPACAETLTVDDQAGIDAWCLMRSSRIAVMIACARLEAPSFS